MRKQFTIKRRLYAWDVLHNEVPIRCGAAKREAIRIALTVGRMQRRLGDDSEIILCDETGGPRARRLILAVGSVTPAVARSAAQRPHQGH
jgi:hypothetical protein